MCSGREGRVGAFLVHLRDDRQASQLANPLKAATFETLIGLLACTGLRAGEAMRLDRSDFDTERGLLTVRNSKFNKSRQVLLHPTTVNALCGYGRRRDELCPAPRAPALLLSSTGARLGHPVLQRTFACLLRETGIGASAPRRPRVHDLRHSFSVATLLRWYRDGGDVAVRMPALSTYLGHYSERAVIPSRVVLARIGAGGRG